MLSVAVLGKLCQLGKLLIDSRIYSEFECEDSITAHGSVSVVVGYKMEDGE